MAGVVERNESALPPIRRSIEVPLNIGQAFDLFVRRLPEWWPLSTRSVWLQDAASCHVEPFVGGRLYERSVSGNETSWGEFVAFEENERVVFTWHPGAPSTSATEVEVLFAPAGTNTVVVLEHRGWERLGDRASFVRGLFDGGWGPILARFDALARGMDLPDVIGPGCTAARSG